MNPMLINPEGFITTAVTVFQYLFATVTNVATSIATSHN